MGLKTEKTQYSELLSFTQNSKPTTHNGQTKSGLNALAFDLILKGFRSFREADQTAFVNFWGLIE